MNHNDYEARFVGEMYVKNSDEEWVLLPSAEIKSVIRNDHLTSTFLIEKDINGIMTNVPHSFDDKPAREYATGQKEWLRNGKPHRTTGPAIVKEDGSYQWYVNGVRHCLTGPAHYHAPMNNYMWYVNGWRVEKKWIIEQGIDPFNITEDDAVILQIKYGFVNDN